MMKKLVLSLSILFCVHAYAQVGIETPLPKGIFHVDGNKDNPKTATTAVTTPLQANDLIVLPNNGNVGIGTNTPITKIDINNGTSNGAIKIVDGNQGAGKYLMSDANGLATWRTPNSFKSAIIWTYNGTEQTVLSTERNPNAVFDESPNRKYSNLSLTGLTTGKWIVNIGLRLFTQTPLNVTNPDLSITPKSFWMHANLSTSTGGRAWNGFNFISSSSNGSAGYASVIYGDGTPNGKGFLSGSAIIDVYSTTPITLYLILEDVGQWDFKTSSPENYFYAIPIN